LPENWIPYTTYILFDNKIPVGFARIRHESSKYLETVIGAGNLGYAIAKSYRGQGYGSTLFSLLLKECKTFGYEKIKLFPLKTNFPTVRIMMKNGGKVLSDFNDEKIIIEIEIK
jgi:predicted acetyltransferase